MKTRKTLLILVAVMALSLVIFAGSALAQDPTPTDEPAAEGFLPQMQQRMEERFGAGAWGEMIARMTQIHGADFVGERMQQMNEEGCPMLDDEDWQGPMMHGGAWSNQDGEQTWGPGMHRFQSGDDETFTPGRGMMGRSSVGQHMMGRGMMNYGATQDDVQQNRMGGRGMWGNGR